MNDKSNKYLTDISQKLRKDMTPEEKHLWYDFLKTLPVTFNRQKVIGKYIVDFYCASAKSLLNLTALNIIQTTQSLKTKNEITI